MSLYGKPSKKEQFFHSITVPGKLLAVFGIELQVGDSVGKDNIVFSSCRWRRLLCGGQELRSRVDHWAGAAAGQGVPAERGGPGRPGQPQRSGHALRGGGSQSAAVHECLLCHFHPGEHT